MVQNKRVYFIGDCLSRKRDSKPFRITHIDERRNAWSIYYLYTVTSIETDCSYCLYYHKLIELFEPDHSAQVLYGNGSDGLE